ncbi:non-specific lipid transfer protein GPI-anchored 5-like [Andrographis paniculata]|uniref:non-specific lipid transfer protein GPI-anchored 5-like n=1 Tax=Andrographis paniculata TaxID=175694 RepID=UPI0021E826FB|nr:non-specific lipid transfer protein GPI-anchored 5-like [Andrographis paniculata]
MAYKLFLALVVTVVVVAFLSNIISAQSGCTTTLMGLSPCLNYVSGNSSTPSSTCCSKLTNVVKSQPQCLCLLLNGTASSYGFNINQTLALGLPDACSVQTPPISKCNAANAPDAASPGALQNRPSDSSKNPATGSDIPSGSKATPTGDKNNGSIANATPCIVLLLVLMTASSYAVSIAGF